MSNKDLKEYNRVNINKKHGYVCYSHPTKRNEKQYVKQITRSIKEFREGNEYNEEKLGILCSELDDLLQNFSDYTKDLTSIEEIERISDAFDWIISEELQNNPDRIIKSTLDKYIPISNNHIIYLNFNDVSLFKGLPESIYISNECQYVFVKSSNDNEYSAVVEFNGVDDLKEEFIKKILKICKHLNQDEFINDKNNSEEEVFKYINDIFYYYFAFKLKDEELDSLIGFVVSIFEKFLEIRENFGKKHKIRKKDFGFSTSFINFVAYSLANENSDLFMMFYDKMSYIINLNISNCDGCVSHKLNYYDKTPKILYLESNDKTEFIEKLGRICSFDNPDQSLRNLVKKIRIKGDFLSDSIEDDCVIIDSVDNIENIIKSITDTKTKICFDSSIAKDSTQFDLLEKLIVFGGIVESDLYFNNISTSHNTYTLKNEIVRLLSKSKFVNHNMYIYANEFILRKILPDGELVSLNHNQKSDKVSTTILDGEYDVYDKFDTIIYDTNISFSNKVEDFFILNNLDYCSKQNITIKVKEFLLESFIYSFYKHLFTPAKLLCYQEREIYSFIISYNSFMKKNLSQINDEINSILVNKLNKIFDDLGSIVSYDVYKENLLYSILKEVKVSSVYIIKLLDEFNLYVNGDNNG